jgi:hypothetical protein
VLRLIIDRPGQPEGKCKAWPFLSYRALDLNAEAAPLVGGPVESKLSPEPNAPSEPPSGAETP